MWVGGFRHLELVPLALPARHSTRQSTLGLHPRRADCAGSICCVGRDGLSHAHYETRLDLDLGSCSVCSWPGIPDVCETRSDILVVDIHITDGYALGNGYEPS